MARAKKVNPNPRKALYKKDVQAALREVSFGPDDRIIAAVHGISDSIYCINRAKEVLITQQSGGSKSEKRDQIIMATRLLLLALILEPAKV